MGALGGDSFDSYNTGQLPRRWTNTFSVNTAPVMTTTPLIAAGGRNGTNSLRFIIAPGALGNGSVQTVDWTWGSSDHLCGMGFSYNPSSQLAGFTAGRYGIASIKDALGNIQVALALNLDNTLSILAGYVFGGMTLLGTTSIPIMIGIPNHIQWGALIDPSGGTCWCYINSVLALSKTGVNTQPFSSSGRWSTTSLGFQTNPANYSSTGGSNVTWDYDDFYVFDSSGAHNNAAPLGDLRACLQMAVAGNGVDTDSTPSTGSDRGAMVSDNPADDDSTYNRFTAPGQRDSYGLQSLPVSGTVVFVQTCQVAKVESAGSRTMQGILNIGSTDYALGTPKGLTTSYADVLQVADVSPATGVAFTISECNNMQAGPKVAA